MTLLRRGVHMLHLLLGPIVKNQDRKYKLGWLQYTCLFISARMTNHTTGTAPTKKTLPHLHMFQLYSRVCQNQLVYEIVKWCLDFLPCWTLHDAKLDDDAKLFYQSKMSAINFTIVPGQRNDMISRPGQSNLKYALWPSFTIFYFPKMLP